MRGLSGCLWAVVLIHGLTVAALPALAGATNAVTRFDRYDGWRVQSCELTGVPEAMSRQLAGGLALSGSWRITGTKRPPFSVDTLNADVQRILLYLAERGYPVAEVVPEVVAAEQEQALDLTLVVIPGPVVTVADVVANGWPEGVAWPDTADTRVFHRGATFTDALVAGSEAYLQLILLDAGYALAEVTASVRATGSLAVPQVEVTYDVVPGDFYRIATVDITGCSDDLIPTVRRVVDIEPGTEFSDELLKRASRDLRSTQLFSTVQLQPEPAGPGQLRLAVELADARMRAWRASFGSWTDNPWMVRAGWQHRNLLKHGIGFDARATYATHEFSLGAGLFWPGWLSPRAQTQLRVSYAEEDEEAYDSREKRLELVQSFRPRPRDVLKVGVSVSDIDVVIHNTDPLAAPVDEGRLLEIWCDTKWDRTDDPLFPGRGGYVKLALTISPPGIFSESPYVALQADVTRYLTLLDGLVLAGRGRVGWARPLGDATDILPNRRYYAGGYNTMRGYKRRHLGPDDSGGDPRGGQFVVLAGAELRFPVVWIVDGALFCDAGQVWREPSELDLGQLAVAVGVDVDFRTPLGPIRIGYARNVSNLVSDEPEDLFHFGIGYPW